LYIEENLPVVKMLRMPSCVEPPRLQPPVTVKKSKKIKNKSETGTVPIPNPITDLKFVKKHVSNKENVSVTCKKTKDKVNPDSKNLVQNPDPGVGSKIAQSKCPKNCGFRNSFRQSDF
jgi:hypothetical protein